MEKVSDEVYLPWYSDTLFLDCNIYDWHAYQTYSITLEPSTNKVCSVQRKQNKYNRQKFYRTAVWAYFVLGSAIQHMKMENLKYHIIITLLPLV